MKTIRVAAGIIREGDRYFATCRGYGPYRGRWEFPGGKIEAGETAEEALVREIREELDTEVAVEGPAGHVEYTYPEFTVNMDCFFCRVLAGDLRLKEHEAAKWLRREELDSVDWLPSDRILLRNLFGKDVIHETETAGGTKG